MAQQPMSTAEFFDEAKRLNLRAPMNHADMCAAFDAKDAELDTLRAQVERLQAERGQVVYAFRRKGQDSFCTCDEYRYLELQAKPRMFEVRTFYASPPAAPYKDSTPDLHVGESSFEGWYGSYLLTAPVHQAKKQHARDAYAAGMGDPLVSRASPPADQASAELRQAAQALVDRWDMPCWKGVQHTGEFINKLREALAAEAQRVDAVPAMVPPDPCDGWSLVGWQHRKPIVGSVGETVGLTSWREGKGLNTWPHRVLYACDASDHGITPGDGGEG